MCKRDVDFDCINLNETSNYFDISTKANEEVESATSLDFVGVVSYCYTTPFDCLKREINVSS